MATFARGEARRHLLDGVLGVDEVERKALLEGGESGEVLLEDGIALRRCLLAHVGGPFRR